jgi:uncharacterized membrane protein HdeD (DUF308 family)
MSTTTSSSTPAVRAVRTALAVSGAVSLIVGLLILLWPGRTAQVAVGIIAVYVIIAGIVNIGIGIFFRSGWARIIEGVVSLTTLNHGSGRGWTIFFAIISILAGVVLLFSPLLGAVTLFILIGASLLVLGVFQIIRAIQFGKTA